MLAILSPAKRLDYATPLVTKKHSEPEFVDESRKLIKVLRGFAPHELAELMGISDKLATLNVERYGAWQPDFDDDAARPAVLAFKGDVYIGLGAETLTERDFTYAQKHLRILSGLHGLLRPLDRIRPYRLEMGTPLTTAAGKDLYEFWGNKVTSALNRALAEQRHDVLVNLASNEYYNVLQEHDIDARIINVSFKERRSGKYRFLSFFAKKARGLMARYMIDRRVRTMKGLKQFDYDGYAFNEQLSKEDDWVFTRDEQR